MELWLIKIGKAWGVLRRDGLLRGSERILSSFFRLFQRVKPGDILFVTNGVGDSARYRAHHIAEELKLAGFRVSVTVQDNPFLLSYRDKFSVFIFHRVLFTEKVSHFIQALKQSGKEIIFEADDLVYDPSYLQTLDYFKEMNVLEKKLYAHGLGGEILADPYVKTATTTTRFLAEKLEAKGKRVFLVPNKLSEEDIFWAEKIYRERKRDEDEIFIGYMSGTASHNQDFATIEPVLEQILERYPKTRLVLAGPLEIGARLQRVSSRIECLPFASRKKHFENIAALDINLAPLVIGDPFCEAKSELKFFEAGIVGVPTVASATGTFKEAIVDGVDGFVAATPEEWQTKLEKFILDTDLRREMGVAARKKVLEKYVTTNAKNESYYTYLKSKITP